MTSMQTGEKSTLMTLLQSARCSSSLRSDVPQPTTSAPVCFVRYRDRMWRSAPNSWYHSNGSGSLRIRQQHAKGRRRGSGSAAAEHRHRGERRWSQIQRCPPHPHPASAMPRRILACSPLTVHIARSSTPPGCTRPWRRATEGRGRGGRGRDGCGAGTVAGGCARLVEREPSERRADSNGSTMLAVVRFGDDRWAGRVGWMDGWCSVVAVTFRIEGLLDGLHPSRCVNNT